MSVVNDALRPYLLGYQTLSGDMLDACPVPGAIFIDSLMPENLLFYRLVNAGNTLAFGGLGMPGWVQFDCATMPTAMIGFALPRRVLEAYAPEVWRKLQDTFLRLFGEQEEKALASYEGLVPVSDYCAAFSQQVGHVVGFSLFSLLGGLGLGVRTKAMALACYGASVQTGVAQYTNPRAVRAHCSFGALRIVSPLAPPHSKPLETFVYEVRPSPDLLATLAREGTVRHDMTMERTPLVPDLRLPCAPEAADAITALLIERHRVHLVGVDGDQLLVKLS